MMLSIFSRRGIDALAASVAVLLSGCTNMSGLDGSAEYGCKAPQGVQCDSVSGNYYNAIQNNLPSQRQRRPTDIETDTAASAARPTPANSAPAARAARLLAIGQSGADTAQPATFMASPLRGQARVLRLWFKPWEDADHDLYDQGFVYVQIDNGRWLIDHAQRRIRDAYAPIRPPRPATPSPSAAQPPTAPTKPADSGFFGARPLESTSGPSKPVLGASNLSTTDSE